MVLPFNPITEESAQKLYQSNSVAPSNAWPSVVVTAQVRTTVEDNCGLILIDLFAESFTRLGASVRRLKPNQRLKLMPEKRGKQLYCVSTNIREEYRNKGVGKHIYQCDDNLCRIWNGNELYMEATEDNTVLAIKRWGFEPVDKSQLQWLFEEDFPDRVGVDNSDFRTYPDSWLRRRGFIDVAKTIA